MVVRAWHSVSCSGEHCVTSRMLGSIRSAHARTVHNYCPQPAYGCSMSDNHHTKRGVKYLGQIQAVFPDQKPSTAALSTRGKTPGRRGGGKNRRKRWSSLLSGPRCVWPSPRSTRWVTVYDVYVVTDASGGATRKPMIWLSAVLCGRGPARLRGSAWPASCSAIGRVLKGSAKLGQDTVLNTPALPELFWLGTQQRGKSRIEIEVSSVTMLPVTTEIKHGYITH